MSHDPASSQFSRWINFFVPFSIFFKIIGFQSYFQLGRLTFSDPALIVLKMSVQMNESNVRDATHYTVPAQITNFNDRWDRGVDTVAPLEYLSVKLNKKCGAWSLYYLECVKDAAWSTRTEARSRFGWQRKMCVEIYFTNTLHCHIMQVLTYICHFEVYFCDIRLIYYIKHKRVSEWILWEDGGLGEVDK